MIIEDLSHRYEESEIGIVMDEFLNGVKKREIIIQPSDTAFIAQAQRRENVGAIVFIPFNYLSDYDKDPIGNNRKVLSMVIDTICETRRLKGPDLSEFEQTKQRLLLELDKNV
ncbi:hypothetical protein KW795_01165 [Candidatus Microgenomates bacterium]|nr:hypothetical protein [Candidatus Microgenomates bacterium]